MVKWMPLMFGIFLVILVLGCTGTKTAQIGDDVTVNYIAKFENGTVFDSSNDNNFIFTIGQKQVIKGFEYAIIGMNEGDFKSVVVSPEDGYGQYSDDMVRADTLDYLKVSGYPAKIGTSVSILVDETVFQGKITELNNTHAIIDFNHPLAGKTIVFDITLVKIN